MLTSKTILLVEDNPSDIALTQRALEKSHIANELVVAEDGQKALDYLWGAGAYAGRDVSGVNSYVRKPVDFRQFAASVEHLGLYWLVLNETPPNNQGEPHE